MKFEGEVRDSLTSCLAGTAEVLVRLLGFLNAGSVAQGRLIITAFHASAHQKPDTRTGSLITVLCSSFLTPFFRQFSSEKGVPQPSEFGTPVCERTLPVWAFALRCFGLTMLWPRLGYALEKVTSGNGQLPESDAPMYHWTELRLLTSCVFEHYGLNALRPRTQIRSAPDL